jgi:hypothetical protein
VAAAIVLLASVFVFFGSMTLGEGDSGFGSGGPLMTASEFRTLAAGDSRAEIERAFGKGEGALSFGMFGETGAALEPMDATCVYYTPGGELAQVCYRDDRLVSKRLYR